jgi:hypothetical protein
LGCQKRIVQFHADEPNDDYQPWACGIPFWIAAFQLGDDAQSFPDAGTLVAFADIGQLQGGYQMSNFSVPAPVFVPPVTGFRHFTFVLEEYTNTGWVTHYAGRSQVTYLREGVSGPWPLWEPAKGRVIPPPLKMPTGKKIVFNQKAGQSGGKIFIVPKINQYSLSAKLNGSGRTVVYVGSETKGTGGDWSYKSGYAKWKGKTQRVGMLTIDYGVVQGKRSKDVYWLFFQKDGRGFFKNDFAGNESQSFWGSFTLQ